MTRHAAALFALLAVLSLAIACRDESSSTPDRGPSDRGPEAATDLAQDQVARPDLYPATAFAPSTTTLSEAACLSHPLASGTSTAAAASRADDLAHLAVLGVKRLRADLLWHVVEKSRGVFDFTGYDAVIADAETAGLSMLTLLAYGNPWAVTPTAADHFYPPDDPADFGAYVKATLSRYKGKLKTVEIWNEPNAGFRFWKSNALGDPKAFGALVKAAFKAARAADPTVKVLFGAPFYHDQIIKGHLKFVEEVYQAHPDLGQFFDGMAVHPYPVYPPSVAPETLSGLEQPLPLMMARVRSQLASHGDGAKPLHVTEVGWPVWQSVSEEQQARYLIRGFLLLVSAGAQSVCWYTLRDHAGNAVPTERTFGLLAIDPDGKTPPTPRTAYKALSTLLATLGGYRLSQDLAASLSLGAGTYAYELVHATTGRKAAVLWTTASNPGAVDLLVSTATATEVGMLGEKKTLSAQGGKVRVIPSGRPLYILPE